MGVLVAVLNKKGENATETAVAMLKILKRNGVGTFGIASPTTLKTEKSIEALQNQNINSPIIVGHAFSKILATDKPQPIKLDSATLVFDGRLYSKKKEISDAEAVAQKLKQNHEKATKNLIDETKGSFAFVVAELEKIIAGRDVLGIQPLYYGENVEFVALSSERKALWRIGIQTTNSFPPGHLASVDKNIITFESIKTLTYSREKKTTLQAATSKLQKLLQHSVSEKVSDLNEIAVAFSGGLDSSLIAFLAKNSGNHVQLITVSLKNQRGIEQAKEVAEDLELPIHVYIYHEEDVEKALEKVLWLIEEPDPIKANVGIPFYWVAERAAAMGFKVMLAGQGADELFGGYKRYANGYLKYGSEKMHKALFNDVLRMYETNFERDFKICNFHNVELRLPFATYQIAKFATKLPVELKIKLPDIGLRKLVLREVAKNLGLPRHITEKPKKAIQYTTGVSKVLKKLASKNDLPLSEYLLQTFKTVLKKMVEHE